MTRDFDYDPHRRRELPRRCRSPVYPRRLFHAGRHPANHLCPGDYGNGFGTHDWVLYEANQLAESEGYFWLRTGAALRATDDPDTRLHDTYHHVYDVWGTTYGDAPDRVHAS